jgi:hypothetical protein
LGAKLRHNDQLPSNSFSTFKIFPEKEMNNQTSARLKVGVLFGGRSPEHEVSILSAKQVVGFLGKSYDVVPIYITKDGKWLTHESLLTDQALKNFEAALKKSSQLVITPDTS